MAYARRGYSLLAGLGDLNCFGQPETADVGGGDSGFQSWLANGIASPPGPYAKRASEYAAEYGQGEALLYYNSYIRSGRPDVCSRGGGVTAIGSTQTKVTPDGAGGFDQTPIDPTGTPIGPTIPYVPPVTYSPPVTYAPPPPPAGGAASSPPPSYTPPPAYVPPPIDVDDEPVDLFPPDDDPIEYGDYIPFTSDDDEEETAPAPRGNALVPALLLGGLFLFTTRRRRARSS